MNAEQTIDQENEQDSEFSLMVKRELRNQATPEEIKYLKDHIPEWKADLVQRLKVTEGHIAQIQRDMEQMQYKCLSVWKELTEGFWFKYKYDQEQKLAKSRGFVHVAQAKLSQLKLYKARSAQQTPDIDEAQRIEKRRKDAYGQGWSDCNSYFYRLMEEGYTLEEAHLMSMSFWNARIRDWQKSSETMKEKPTPIRGGAEL